MVGEGLSAIVPSANAFGFLHVIDIFVLGVVDRVVIRIFYRRSGNPFFDIKAISWISSTLHVILLHSITSLAKSADAWIAFCTFIAVESGATLAIGPVFRVSLSVGVVFGVVINVIACRIVSRLPRSFNTKPMRYGFANVDVHLRYPERK